MCEILGGTIEETGAAEGLATKLPLDQVDNIVFRDKSFCCTGQFIFGTRTACEKAIVERGGSVCDGVRVDLGYLVIGMMATHDWAHSTFGRKIEKAVEYCWRRPNIDHPCRLNIDQGWKAVRCAVGCG